MVDALALQPNDPAYHQVKGMSAAGLVCAVAVMFPPKDDEPPRGGLRGNVIPADWKLRLVRVRATRS